MDTITQDGFTFESGWIDCQTAKFKDEKILWPVRRYKLSREIAEHTAAMESMPETMPLYDQTMAHAKAYLAALNQASEDLNVEAMGK
jgi:hypothetical protein